MTDPIAPHPPDEQLLALVGAALKHFGRGIRCTLRVSGVQAVLIFPEPTSNKPEPSTCSSSTTSKR